MKSSQLLGLGVLGAALLWLWKRTSAPGAVLPSTQIGIGYVPLPPYLQTLPTIGGAQQTVPYVGAGLPNVGPAYDLSDVYDLVNDTPEETAVLPSSQIGIGYVPLGADASQATTAAFDPAVPDYLVNPYGFD